MFFDIIKTMRPRQWTKNLFVFAALVFSRRFLEPGDTLRVLGSFIIFCVLSGAVYIINDIVDREKDRRHELKRTRPIASGRLSCGTAALFAAVLAAAAFVAAFSLGRSFGVVAACYFALMIVYSFFLKHVVIVDVLVIASGFVLRAAAGGCVIHVVISPWLLICTILIALFMVLSKRRHELVLLEDNAAKHRRTLLEYSPYLLDQMIAVVTSSTVMAYALYTMWPRTIEEVSPYLYLTIPFVLYGIFRYLYLVHQKEKGGSPERLLLSDMPLMVDIILWIIAVGVILSISN